MKTAIVYYSMLGNTKYVAETIYDELKKSGENIDIIEIKPEKAYPSKGAKKFIWGGKSAVMGETPKLMPYKFNAEDYDRIIIGTPVWASTFTPPIKTFLKENSDISGKKISVFVSFSGGGADKTIEKLKKYIGVEELESELILIDPNDNKKAEDILKISDFCSKLK